VNSYGINEDRADVSLEQPTLLNSYITDYLVLVSSAPKRNDVGAALARYLTANPGVPRTGVQLNPLVVREPSPACWAPNCGCRLQGWRTAVPDR
jgi:hypothetical protein